jgi:two-component system, NtrC family, response regulator AtoC
MTARSSFPTLDDVTKETDASAHQRRGARHVLLVIREDGTSDTHPLPSSGTVIIGRSRDCDLRIDDPSMSRRHAALHLGPPLAVEDLGSANGTRVRDARMDPPSSQTERTGRFQDRKLEPRRRVELSPGDVILLGSAMAFVQHGAPAARPRRIWPHGYFEGCLEKECARSERSGASFAVVRLRIEGVIPSSVVEESLAASTRSVDILALYGPNEYELLLVDAAPAKIDDVTRRIVERLESHGAKVRLGVARHPDDARDPESLVAKAGARAQGLEAMEGLPPSVVVEDPAMQRLYRMAQRIADSSISVLLLGETGVGKEVLAEAIHNLSPRANKPFLRLNCAAFAEQLLESELFGFERGSFTGATQAKPGLFETADGGTVFLDEVGEIPLSTQAKLLRVLEERKVMRVGALRPRSIDVRFIAATNRDLEGEVERQTFREDLYFRLNGISLLIPPLRERPSEILPLARAFLADFGRLRPRAVLPEISPEAVALLLRYSFPGNIRELRNVMERALLLSADGEIRPDHLPVEKMGATVSARSLRTPLPPPPSLPPRPKPAPHPAESWPTVVPPPPDPPETERLSRLDLDEVLDLSTDELRQKIEDVDRERVRAALAQCAGNQTQAAKLLGISRRTLVSRLEAYNLPRPRKKISPDGS